MEFGCGIAQQGVGYVTKWYQSPILNNNPAWTQLTECREKNCRNVVAKDVYNSFIKITIVKSRGISQASWENLSREWKFPNFIGRMKISGSIDGLILSYGVFVVKS